MNDLTLSLALSPGGRLRLVALDDAPALSPGVARRLSDAFAKGQGHGLLQLGAGEVGQLLPPALSYWRAFAGRYVAALCGREGAGEDSRDPADPAAPNVPAPDSSTLAMLALGAPAMPGSEYLDAEVLGALFEEVGRAFAEARSASGKPLSEFLKSLNPIWNVVGRVHFHLAENRKDEQAPFAFLATYTTRLSAHGKAQHLPLGQALKEYAGASNRERLLSLLLPVKRAAEKLPWLRTLVDTGEIFHPLRWSPADAYRLLSTIPDLESAGVVVRMPAGWPSRRPSRPRVTATVGTGRPAGLGQDALLDFRMELTLDGEVLTPAEVETLLAGTDGLAMIRGRWVEVDPARIENAMERLKAAERLAAAEGLTFATAMRLLSGAAPGEDGPDADGEGWTRVVAGPWMKETLAGLRSPEGLSRVHPGPELRGTLRPYQEIGVRWLHLLSRLGFGACLADDMGLGKTIQVLSLLLVDRKETPDPRGPSLLVAPASLLANWTAEIDRFAPGLRALVAHPSAMRADQRKKVAPDELEGTDLVITSYGSLKRIPWLGTTEWNLLVLDEAQAIKNPGTRQTRAVKMLHARARIALTGTPVENRLGDLWSIFDFLNPGLLGTAREFSAYTKSLADRSGNPWGPLRDLVRPYVLRRLKTDRSVIADLPEKTEVKAFCPLSRRQAALYSQAVGDLARRLEDVDGIARRGAVLAFLMRLKQILNHPSQWLGDGEFAEADSGKFGRLREIVEVIAAKQEKALVFTQFREITSPLAAFLSELFGRPGVVLTGETPVRERRELVRRFQEDESVPFFVLSLKAGGTGLNLTAASHVVHFDRWWNPAVENQATDRAFRIGQKRNVLVHKFVCRGTVEEKIDALIESKVELSKGVLEGGGEVRLTELPDEELLRLVTLDLGSIPKE